jgi:TM2 domain-containing membrane protein YozV
MSNQQTASDGLKHATYLWRTERNEKYARSILDDLLARYPDSDEAAAASNLLEQINNAAVSVNETSISAPSKNKEIRRHLIALVMVASGVGLIFLGRGVMYSGPIGDGGIYGLFGVLIIAAGGLVVVVTTTTWVLGTLAQLFGGKRLVGWLCILLAAAVIVSIAAPVIGVS